jgi:hypothetical protein
MSGRHKNKGKKHKAGNRPTHESNEPSGATPENLSGAPSENATPNDKSQSEAKTMRVFKKPESMWTVAGVVVAAIVAAIYFLQWRTMIESVDTARRSSERETRALVNLKQNGSLTLVPNKTIELPVRVNNIGRTTAGRVIVVSAVELIPRLNSPNLSDSDILPLYRTEIGGVFPGDHSDFNIIGQKVKGEARKGGGTEGHVLTNDELSDLTAGKTYIATHGSVAYDDVFHVRHWTQFCFWWSFTSLEYNASDCTAYNTQDDGDEP